MPSPYLFNIIELLRGTEATRDNLRVSERAEEVLQARAVADDTLSGVQKTFDAFASCAEFLGFAVNENVLELAKNVTTKLILVCHVIGLAKAIANLGLDISEWISSRGGGVLI